MLNPFLDIKDALKFEIKSKYDVICPIYWLNDVYFLDNVESWIKEIPINRLIFGINNKNVKFEKLWSEKIKLLSHNCEILVIDQTHHKTLGICLADLMKCVETEWFVYVHADVKLTPKSFYIMESEKNKKIGIIESERIFFDGITQTEGHTHYTKRAYSGFQLIQKESIRNIIDEIEDDFIYRNEDLIFQSRCKQNGFEYKKVLAYHIHQLIKTQYTFNDKDIAFMQWKGLVKYTQPDDITKEVCWDPIKECLKKWGQLLIQILPFTWENNPNWGESIIEYYEKEFNGDKNSKR